MKAAFMQSLLVLRALCLVTLAGGQPKAPLKCSIHCNGFTSKIEEKRIRSYRRTEPSCRKQAIIFTTLKSKEICAHPNATWVKEIVDKLDQKATAFPLPRDAISAEEPGGFQKQVGLTVMAPSQASVPTSFFQGTGTTGGERIHAPTVRTEMSNKSPGRQDSTQLPAGSSSVIGEDAVHSEVTAEANRHSLSSPASSASVVAGMDSIQPTPHPTLLVHGFYSTVGSTEEPLGHTANATADVQDTTNSNSMATQNPVAPTKGSDQPVLSTNESLDSTSARANAPDTASSSSRSYPPSILDSGDFPTTPDMPILRETSSVSTPNSTTAIDKGASVHSNKVVGSSADGFGNRTFDYSPPVGKQEPSDTFVFPGQTFPGQARVQMTPDKPNDLPLSSFLSVSQMHFVIPVSVVSGLTICSVALVWLYLKFGVKPEESSREMVQGLLYQKAEHQNNVYPMEVI